MRVAAGRERGEPVRAEASSEEVKVVRRAGIAGFFSLPALGAVLLWSGVSPFGKYALREFPTLAYTGLRPVIASALIFAFLALRRQPLAIARRDWPRLAVAGFVGMGVSQLCFIGGLALTSVAHNVILAATSPLIGALIRWGVRRESPDRLTVLGLGAGFAGVVVLVSAAAGGAGTSVAGDLISLGAAVTWVVATVVPLPLIVRYGAPQTTAWMLLGAAALIFPIGAFSLPRVVHEPPATLAWLSLFYTSAIGMLGGNALWQRSVKEIGPARTLPYLYLEPFGALILAALFLGERLSAVQAAGGVLALVGVALVRKG